VVVISIDSLAYVAWPGETEEEQQTSCSHFIKSLRKLGICLVSTPVHNFHDYVKMGNIKLVSLLFADGIARLVSSVAGLKRALDRFAAECSSSGMRIRAK
jgi:hypothetical protein